MSASSASTFTSRLPVRHIYQFHDARVVWTIALLCVAVLTGLARAAEPVLDRELDVSNATESAGKFYVVFCARKSKDQKEGLGHAFVVWGKEDEQKKLSSAEAFGFYPADGDDKKALFGDVPGKLASEATGKLSLVTHRLRVKVNKKAWDESRKQIDKWKTEKYNLFQQNCTHFTSAVAGDIGLIVEKPKSERPNDFLSRLIEETKSKE